MIVAVDFDGVLCEDAFPEIGTPNYDMVSAVRELIDAGHEVILWTCRAGDRLTEAVEWCDDRGLHFCAVNDNAPSNKARYSGEYPVPSPKVYADVYVDDHGILAMRMDRERRSMSSEASNRGALNEMRHIIRKEYDVEG